MSITEYLTHLKVEQEKVVELVQYLYTENERLRDSLEAKELDHKSSNAAARKAQRDLEILTKKYEELQRQVQRKNSYSTTSTISNSPTATAVNPTSTTTAATNISAAPGSNTINSTTTNGTIGLRSDSPTKLSGTNPGITTSTTILVTDPLFSPDLSPTTVVITQPDQLAIARLKSLSPRACNEFYLTDTCTRPACGYSHTHELTPEEVDALRFLARLNRCNFGKECVNERCYRGHTCQSVRDGRCMRAKCPFGEDEHPGVGVTPGKA